MNKQCMPVVGTQVLMLTREDLDAVVRGIIKEENDRRDAERSSARVTASEVAKMLNVDKSTLWRWRKSGRLKGVKVGKEITYKESDVLKLLGEA
ncbi:MAG: helix-turn-helix domain-containing protein [Bacteroidales bacterium]|nr:helix-turn-helix domain-containing protein [Bacteroidales bacterium]